jgi:hypothetical protein
LIAISRHSWPCPHLYDAQTGTITGRDRADGPALIWHHAQTGKVIREEWWKDDKRFEPSAEIRAAWLKNGGELAAPFASAPSAPAPG